MKYLSSRKVLALVVLFVMSAAVVSCGDDNGDSDNCDPGYSWTYDPDADVQETGESGFDPLFYPPDPVCLPEDVSLYKNNLMGGFYDWVREKAVAYLDPTCVADCEDMQDFEECEEANCTAPDGTIIEYLRTVNLQEESNEDSSSVVRDTNESLTISPPEGLETWSEIKLEYSSHSQSSSTGGEGFGSSNSNYQMSWEGAIHQGLPEDYSLTASRSGSYTSNSEERHFQLEHETMALSYDTWDGDSFGALAFRINLNDTEIEIWYGGYWYLAWIDDVCVGEAEDWTWKIIGECEE